MSQTRRKRHVVLYDSDCPLCTFQMKLLTWLDWFDLVDLIPITDPRAFDIAPQLTPDALSSAIHCIEPDETVHRGARAFRFLGMRMPLLLPVALVLWLPGVIWFAERFYMWVSRNRLVLSRLFGCKGACALMPERSRPRGAD